MVSLTDSIIPLINWISDTRPQGCTDLQSPVKCLDHSVVLDYVPSAASLTAAAPPAAVTIARYSAKGSNSQQHILRHTATMRAVCSLVLGLRWGHHQPASSWWCMPVDNFVCFVSSCSVCTFLCVMCCYAQFALHTQPMHLTPRHM